MLLNVKMADDNSEPVPILISSQNTVPGQLVVTQNGRMARGDGATFYSIQLRNISVARMIKLQCN